MGRNQECVMSKKLKASEKFLSSTKHKKTPASKILGKVIIKYDVGFGNVLFIRGRGAGLSWDKGISLKNKGSDEWVWEPKQTFNECEFKVLINDQMYETGENHWLTFGACIQYTPSF